MGLSAEPQRMLKRHMRGTRPTMAALKGRKDSPVATIGLEAFMARPAVRRAIDYIDKTTELVFTNKN
jgi:hypothetical protein